jgi:hypothetical protein
MQRKGRRGLPFRAPVNYTPIMPWPPKWKVVLAAVGCLGICLALSAVYLTFKPTAPGELTDISGTVSGWEKQYAAGETSGDRFDWFLSIEGQTARLGLFENTLRKVPELATIDKDLPPGSAVTLKVTTEHYKQGGGTIFELKSDVQSYLSLEQSQEAERDNVRIAFKMGLAFGAGFLVLLPILLFYDRLTGAVPASAGAAAVERLAAGTPTEADYAALLAHSFLLPTAAPYAPGAPLQTPTTKNEAGEEFIFLFSTPDSFRTWGQAPHSAELSGKDAFAIVLANPYAGAVIDVSGPRMLGLTRGVIESLVK